MTNELHSVTVRVPATSANMGPGFDCLGMALDIYDTITLSVRDGGGHWVAGEGIERGYGELILKSALALYGAVGRKAPALAVQCQNEIPIGKGLGSSAAAIVGGLVAANELAGRPMGQEELAILAARIEGHADNTTPALFGGCRVMVMDGEQLIHAQVPLPAGLRAVLFIPDFQMPTEESRKLLPKSLTRAQAIHNIGRAALLVAALAAGRLELLRVATQDQLHQPARSQLFPAMSHLFQAALEAGALGVYLSGGGPTILALALEGSEEIAAAMESAARSYGVAGESRIAAPTWEGAQVIEAMA